MKALLLLFFLIVQPPMVEVLDKSEYRVFVEQGFSIIDVRTPKEYKEGHIEGSKNIDIGSESFVTEIQKISKSDTILVYCRSGRRSIFAAQVMVSFGFQKIYDLEGGFLNWMTD